ncbi:MAG: type IV pilus assembly protein PilQ [Gammaproteobacteria bacterium]|jgi:type IV pilus assembly protein PilQ
MSIKKMMAFSSVIMLGMFFQSISMAVTLDNVEYSSLPGDKVQINLIFSESLIDEPVNFTIDNPARIAIDLPDVQLNLDERNQTIGIGDVLGIVAVEAAGRTRVVVNLVRSGSYDMRMQGQSVILTIGSNAIATTQTASAPSSFVSSREPTSSGSSSIQNIDFRRGEGGEGRIVVTLSDPTTSVNLGEEGGKIFVDFISVSLPSELDRRLNVIDFATPVSEIDTTSNARGTRMVISTVDEQYDHLAYQSGNLFTIEVTPLTQQEQEAQQKQLFGFTGERLSLNFQDIEVRAVLQLIADFTGLNLVASDTVSGSVTLRLRNVPWDQALDIILKSKGLGMRQAGNVMMVGPQEEIAARERLELESQRQVEELSPLRTEFMQINYAKASDFAGLIQTGESSLLSQRGSVSIDERTNTLIVQDVSLNLGEIRDMIAILDIPIRQVMIESRIVNADENFTKDLGVQFGYSKHTDQVAQLNGDLFGAIGGGIPGKTAFEPGATSFNTGGTENLLVNLPVAGATSAASLAVGKIGSYLLSLELSALLAEGRGEDIASPKVITANQSQAVIESGVQIPYQAATSSGATAVSFIDATLSLTVTPQITPDNRVMLDLNVTQNSRGSPDVLGTPPINTRNVATNVLVDDGETVVLGGIYNQVDRNSLDRVPFFGDLPYLGFLFKKNRVEKSRTELLIFVTPKILKEDLTL